MSERAPSRWPTWIALCLSVAALAWAGVLTGLLFLHFGRRTIVAEKFTVVDSANEVVGVLDARGLQYDRDADHLFGLAFDSTGAPGLWLYSASGGATIDTRDTVQLDLQREGGASAYLDVPAFGPARLRVFDRDTRSAVLEPTR